jgi:hypothetical protein
MKKSLALACLLPSLAAAAPAFEQASLRFFEQSDGPILPVARRIYTTRFDAVGPAGLPSRSWEPMRRRNLRRPWG